VGRPAPVIVPEAAGLVAIVAADPFGGLPADEW
jgi:hypothetical protein